jgi:hypothetical protein
MHAVCATGGGDCYGTLILMRADSFKFTRSAATPFAYENCVIFVTALPAGNSIFDRKRRKVISRAIDKFAPVNSFPVGNRVGIVAR